MKKAADSFTVKSLPPFYLILRPFSFAKTKIAVTFSRLWQILR
jgi:hypothetical protein